MSKTKQGVIELDEITKADLGNQQTIRENSTRGEEVVKIELGKIVIRKGFNVRHDMGDLEALADSILENGQSVAGRVEVLENGTFAITDGHRRFEACKILEKRGHEVFFRAIVNPAKTTEEQRLLQMFTTQDNKPLNPSEQAELIQRLINLGHKANSIAKKIGRTPAYVGQLLEYASEIPAIKKHVNSGRMSVSTSNKLRKEIPNTTERTERINTAVSNKAEGRITTTDVIVAPVNSFKELKVFLKEESIENITEPYHPLYKFLTQIANNEMNLIDIKEYFKLTM